MRSKFTVPGEGIYYYVVEWDSGATPWSDFRGKVLGPTDPAEAPEDSLRGLILKDWEQLGLKEVPNVGDNGVHASASPFEALAERNNWLSAAFAEDPFGGPLLKCGIPEETIKAWTIDPQVVIDGSTGTSTTPFLDHFLTQSPAQCHPAHAPPPPVSAVWRVPHLVPTRIGCADCCLFTDVRTNSRIFRQGLALRLGRGHGHRCLPREAPRNQRREPVRLAYRRTTCLSLLQTER